MAFEPEPPQYGGGSNGGASIGAGEALVKGITNAAKAVGRKVKEAFGPGGPNLGTHPSKTLGQLRGPQTTVGGPSTRADMSTAGEATQRSGKVLSTPTKMSEARGSAALSKASAGLNRRVTGGAAAGAGGAAAVAAHSKAARSAVSQATVGGHVTKPGAQGRSAAESGHPVHTPVSHPGTGKAPIKAATGNRGHATVHPPKPETSHAAPSRHTRPQHATAKATGGTQKTHSSGTKAGHPAAKKAKKAKKTKAK